LPGGEINKRWCGSDFDFNILTALKGWVGLAPKGPGALHIYQVSDLAKFDEDIFYCWFVLQHFMGYKPFITKISITETCYGKF